MFISEANDLVVAINFAAGVNIYNMDGTYRCSHKLKGIITSSASNDVSTVIFGTISGTVCVINIGKDRTSIDEKSFRQIYKHEGPARVVDIA